MPRAKDEVNLQEHWDTITNELNSDNPRVCAIIGGTIIDSALEYALRCRLRKDASIAVLGRDGSFGTARARADLAYAMGAIPAEIYADIKLILEIRNKFAHTLLLPAQSGSHPLEPLSFKTPVVAGKCTGLQIARALVSRVEGEPSGDFEKRLFIESIIVIAQILLNHKKLTMYIAEGSTTDW